MGLSKTTPFLIEQRLEMKEVSVLLIFSYLNDILGKGFKVKFTLGFTRSRLQKFQKKITTWQQRDIEN